ncbi:MAG: tRNA uridine-5-carboxymethylaminomethyl(34) synthesis GTPase MnmE [Bacteroidales bacterium]|nr:tRNA uridine-5-carboxymethylaminomethyl(34) synthesis GTPase MnmE [Bacteroidales bacterium]
MSQYIDNTTICACATGACDGAVSLIRVAGEDAIKIVGSVFTPTSSRISSLQEAKGGSFFYGTIEKGKTILDEVIVSVFRAPASYTGEDVVEIACHASGYIVSEILALLTKKGAKLATAGEFTKRAFLNGKMDLAQAEAVADLIACETKASHRLAMQQLKGGISKELAAIREELLKTVSLIELELDFSEEDVVFADRSELKRLLSTTIAKLKSLTSTFKMGNAIKRGVPVAIVGATNTGKSTLLNAILGEERAIVSSIPGTTRDTIEDTVNIGGILFRFIDTAGIRFTLEVIEQLGIERTYFKIKEASIVILMLDFDRKQDFEEAINSLSKRLNSEEQKVIILINKCDNFTILPGSGTEDAVNADREKTKMLERVGEKVSEIATKAGLAPIAILPISAKQQTGLDNLRKAIADSQKGLIKNSDTLMVTNLRHYNALKEAYDALLRATVALSEGVSSELVAQDIREAIYSLGTIVGEILPAEVLGSIFSRFCIGK